MTKRILTPVGSVAVSCRDNGGASSSLPEKRLLVRSYTCSLYLLTLSITLMRRLQLTGAHLYFVSCNSRAIHIIASSYLRLVLSFLLIALFWLKSLPVSNELLTMLVILENTETSKRS